jgi:diguanylate cyclase (GGDEF)-like protein/PAS domain S-box-containing protein
MLERALESLLAGLVVSDATAPGCPIVYANIAWEELTGYDRSEAFGRNCSFLRGPDTDSAAEAELTSAVREQRHTRVTLLNYRKDGTPFWNEVSLSPIFDETGKLVRWVELQFDVTERERAIQGLRNAEERYRSVVNALEEGVIVMRGNGEVLSCNPSAERILGFDPTEPDAMWAWGQSERYWEDGSPATVDNSLGQRVLDTGESHQNVHMRFRHPNGELRWLSLNYQRAIQSSAEDEPQLVISFRDITRRRQVMDELRRSEDRLRTVIDSAPVIVFALGPDGTIELSEGHGLKALGFTPGELVGQRAHDIYADNPPVLEMIERALGGEDLMGTIEAGDLVLESHMTPVRDERGQVVGVLGVSVDVTERTKAQARLSHMALHDDLTGLPNRSLFIDRVEHALARGRREGTRSAVLFIDLDRFKRINDSLGHRAGDQILLETADRIAGALRADDTVARLGGDEFTVLCEGISSEAEALAIADKVFEELGHLYEVDDGELYITASIGVALSDGDASPEQLLRDADSAMYRAKGRGRARTELFDEASRGHAVKRLALESQLHGAIDRGEISLHYQPKVSVAAGRVVGYEALLRWEHPTRGLLVPDDFISVAEDSGLIVPIGRWVLTEAARQAAEWGQGSEPPPVMCVNLSARQFAQPDIVEMVAGVIEETGVNAESLCLEITESVVMEQSNGTVTTLDELKELGVQLAIDDFGTGYSSLGYLKRFRLDFLKIDRSFVDGLGRDPEQTAIVDAIVRLAQALSLGVIAEGVERAEQLEVLKRLGCDLVQGYLFAYPEPPERAGELLNRPIMPAELN